MVMIDLKCDVVVLCVDCLKYWLDLWFVLVQVDDDKLESLGIIRHLYTFRPT